MNLGGAHSRDPDVQLIDKVEEAQVHSPVTKQVHSPVTKQVHSPVTKQVHSPVTKQVHSPVAKQDAIAEYYWNSGQISVGI